MVTSVVEGFGGDEVELEGENELDKEAILLELEDERISFELDTEGVPL